MAHGEHILEGKPMFPLLGNFDVREKTYCDNGSPKWGTVINFECSDVLMGILFPTMGNRDQLQVLLKLLEYKFPTMGNHYPSPKSQTVYIDNCLSIQSDFSGSDNGSQNGHPWHLLSPNTFGTVHYRLLYCTVLK